MILEKSVIEIATNFDMVMGKTAFRSSLPNYLLEYYERAAVWESELSLPISPLLRRRLQKSGKVLVIIDIVAIETYLKRLLDVLN